MCGPLLQLQKEDMLTLKLLRDDPEFVISKLAVKNFDARPVVEKVLALDEIRRNLQAESDGLLAQQKVKAALIGGLMKEGKKAEAEEAKKEVAELLSTMSYSSKNIFRVQNDPNPSASKVPFLMANRLVHITQIPVRVNKKITQIPIHLMSEHQAL